MLRQPHASESDQHCATNSTPMLDAVFVLLVFFIVTASFVLGYAVDVVSPPASQADEAVSAPLFKEIVANNGRWIEPQTADVRRIRAHIATAQFIRPGSGVVIVHRPQTSTSPLIQLIDAPRHVQVYDINPARRDL